MSITSHGDGDIIYVQQHVAGAVFAWNTAYSLEEAREVVRQLEALLRKAPSPRR